MPVDLRKEWWTCMRPWEREMSAAQVGGIVCGLVAMLLLVMVVCICLGFSRANENVKGTTIPGLEYKV